MNNIYMKETKMKKRKFVIINSKSKINMDVLEGGTLKGLFTHFTDRMKLGDMGSFLNGIKSYFDPNAKNKPDGPTEWLNNPG